MDGSNVVLEFREIFWGPLAGGKTDIISSAAWIGKVACSFVWTAALRRVARPVLLDALHLLCWMIALCCFIAGPLLLSTFSVGIACYIAGSIAVVGWFLRHVIGDLARYFCTDEYNSNYRIRRRIQARGEQAIKHALVARPSYDHVIPVAHSLGSVILMDCMRLAASSVSSAQWQRLNAIFTLGSPLAKCALLKLGSQHFECPLDVALAGKRWHNIYYGLDPVADALDTSSCAVPVENMKLERCLPLVCHMDYWTDPEVALQVLLAVQSSSPASACNTEVVQRAVNRLPEGACG